MSRLKSHVSRWGIIVLSCLYGGILLAGDAVPDIRIFPEKERKYMLKSYWSRMSKEQPIQEKTLKEWEPRSALILKNAMDGFGLTPRPPNVPLNITYGSKLERDDCTISRVYYQTFPGFYATAFLYMPKNATFPAPAVLHPHGHWANWSADDIVQSRCIGLAKRGYVSLAIQYEHFEDLATGLPMRGVFLWNNIRGLDVLESLPQVDKNRIGVTGASGGGMQSLDVAAMDPRIKCAAIAVFPTYFNRVCYFHTFGCLCYYSPLGVMRYMDQQEMIATIAPRPVVQFTVTGDWTNEFIDHEAQEVAAVYDFFSSEAGPKVENVEGNKPYRLLSSKNGRYIAERWEGPHDYTKAMRERMYWWMDWWLKGKRDPKPLPEEDLKMEKPAALQALRGEVQNSHQWSNPNLASVVRNWLKYQTPVLKNKAELVEYSRKMKPILEDLLDEKDSSIPKTVESSSVGKESLADWDIEKLWYVSEPDVRIPALLIKPKGGIASSSKVVVVASANGKNDVFVEPLKSICDNILKEGRVILAIDQRLRGEWAFTVSPGGQIPVLAWQGNVRVWGRPELGMAAHDIRTAVTYLGTRRDCSLESLRVVGTGHTAGYAALLAACIDERIKECVADLNHSDFSEGYSDRAGLTAPAYAKRAPVLARILRYGDVGEIAVLVAPRKLELLNASPYTNFQTAEFAYQIMEATTQFVIRRSDEGADREKTVVNGGFEDGSKGWKCEDGSAPVLSNQKAALGKACLQLGPKKKVIGEPIAVKPLTEYRLFMRVSKPLNSTLNVELLRDGKPFKLVSDNADRMTFEECDYDFLSKPGEGSVQIILSASDYKPEAGGVFVDSVRLVEEKQMEMIKPDGKEYLNASDFTKLDVGAVIPAGNNPKGFFIPYGPGSENKVVADGKDGRKALYIKSGSGAPYAALGCLTSEPLKRGGLYRMEVLAKGKGKMGMCFWQIPAHLTPRLDNVELTGEWKTYTLDFFVESQQQVQPSATLSVTGEMWVDHMSLKLSEIKGQ